METLAHDLASPPCIPHGAPSPNKQESTSQVEAPTQTAAGPPLLSLSRSLLVSQQITHSHATIFVSVVADWHSLCLRFRGGPRQQCPCSISAAVSTTYSSKMRGVVRCHERYEARALLEVPGAGQRLHPRGQQRG